MSCPREFTGGAFRILKHSAKIKEDKHPIDLCLDKRGTLGLPHLFFDEAEKASCHHLPSSYDEGGSQHPP
jgi:hypothetical protein